MLAETTLDKLVVAGSAIDILVAGVMADARALTRP
jgi:hypothetical protein